MEEYGQHSPIPPAGPLSEAIAVVDTQPSIEGSPRRAFASALAFKGAEGLNTSLSEPCFLVRDCFGLSTCFGHPPQPDPEASTNSLFIGLMERRSSVKTDLFGHEQCRIPAPREGEITLHRTPATHLPQHCTTDRGVTPSLNLDRLRSSFVVSAEGCGDGGRCGDGSGDYLGVNRYSSFLKRSFDWSSLDPEWFLHPRGFN